MIAGPFLDTNILVYALAQNDPRALKAERLLAAGGRISVQSLNEFTAVARRKLAMTWPEIEQALAAIQRLCPAPTPVTADLHARAVQLAKFTGYTIYDALIIAAALEAGSATLFTEDLRDGQVIEGRLTIRDPFR
jgi:predicted nucleic acid-binding protein